MSEAEKPSYEFHSNGRWLGNVPYHRMRLEVHDGRAKTQFECWENMGDLSAQSFNDVFLGMTFSELPTSTDKRRIFLVDAPPATVIRFLKGRTLLMSLEQATEAHKALGITSAELAADQEKARAEYEELMRPARDFLDLSKPLSGQEPSR